MTSFVENAAGQPLGTGPEASGDHWGSAVYYIDYKLLQGSHRYGIYILKPIIKNIYLDPGLHLFQEATCLTHCYLLEKMSTYCLLQTAALWGVFKCPALPWFQNMIDHS